MTQMIDIIAEKNVLCFSCQTNFPFHCFVIVDFFVQKQDIDPQVLNWSQISIIYIYAVIVAFL